jgi:hypothetical protein
VDRHVQQQQRRHHHLAAAVVGRVGQEDPVPLTQEEHEGGFGEGVDAGPGIPRNRVAHELAVRRDLVVRPRAEDGEGDTAGVQVGGVLEVPDGGRAAPALVLERPAVAPHVLEDEELVVPVEELKQ